MTHSKIKALINRNLTLIKNLSSLSIINIINIFAPIVTIPYLIRVLGTETYGAVIFAQSISLYLEIIVKFGFNITAVNNVSKNRKGLELSTIVSEVFVAKFLLFLFTLFVFISIVTFTNVLKGFPFLLIFSSWVCLYQAIFPDWYFQGIEDMKFITLSNLILRVFSIVFIFSFVKNSSDYLLVPIFYGSGALLSSLVSIFIVFKYHKIDFVLPSMKRLKTVYVESFPIFISQVSQLYTRLNKIIIGTFMGLNEVTIFDLADKIIGVLKIPITIINQTIFPRISLTKSISFIKKSLVFSLLLNTLLLIMVYMFGNKIIGFFTSNAYLSQDVFMLVKVLSFSLLLITFNVFFLDILYVYHYKQKYTLSILFSSVAYSFVIIAIWGFNAWDLMLISLAIIFAELTTLLFSFYYINKFKLFASE